MLLCTLSTITTVHGRTPVPHAVPCHGAHLDWPARLRWRADGARGAGAQPQPAAGYAFPPGVQNALFNNAPGAAAGPPGAGAPRPGRGVPAPMRVPTPAAAAAAPARPARQAPAAVPSPAAKVCKEVSLHQPALVGPY